MTYYPKKASQVEITQGWACYLRVSTEDAQNPRNSHEGQRRDIQEQILSRSELPQIEEYVDIESGRNPSRSEYQRMLSDLRSGKFSHVAVANPDRFGRNAAEAMRAVNEIKDLGASLRFASMPEADIYNMDQRLVIGIMFMIAENESDRIGQRVKTGMLTKMKSGGFVGTAPDGYINAEKRTTPDQKASHGRYTRWVEPDPQRQHIWREAWDLLLSGKYTLNQICEVLHYRGYTLKSGRAFMETTSTGRKRYASSAVSRVFHNAFYAGWVVSARHAIAPYQVRGDWQALVSDEEFQRGLLILEKRTHKRVPEHKHFYLLKGMLFLQQGEDLIRMTGTKPNTRRPGGGTAYYRVPNGRIHLRCAQVDKQVISLLSHLHVEAPYMESMRKLYRQEISSIQNHPKDSLARLHEALQQTYEEERRVVNLVARGSVSEAIWEGMWKDWQTRRQTLQQQIRSLEHTDQVIVRHFDEALEVLHRLPELYDTLTAEEKRDLLRAVIDKIIVNPEGEVIGLSLHPPFGCLNLLSHELKKSSQELKENSTTGLSGAVFQEKFQTILGVLSCSSYVSLGVPDRNRTYAFGSGGQRSIH